MAIEFDPTVSNAATNSGAACDALLATGFRCGMRVTGTCVRCGRELCGYHLGGGAGTDLCITCARIDGDADKRSG